MLVVLVILFSAVVAGHQAVSRLLDPQPVGFLWAVAVFRIRVGRQIGSAALIADGQHARTDGWTSLAVLAGAVGVWLGYPLADPVVGILICVAILVVVYQSGKAMFSRLLDGVEPKVVEEIRATSLHAPGVQHAAEVRARWSGHRLRAEVNVTVDPDLSVSEGHEVDREVNHRLMHRSPFLEGAVVHVDPTEQAGEGYHRLHHAHSH